nr:MAG TPA: hypothetical protein [Caudoviricetes sp.]
MRYYKQSYSDVTTQSYRDLSSQPVAVFPSNGNMSAGLFF